VPTLRTVWHEVAALRDRDFAPYSDILLHDMGTLGDGIARDGARAARGAPRLYGACARPRRSCTTAARPRSRQRSWRRTGRGPVSHDRFRALGAADRRAQPRFLRSL